MAETTCTLSPNRRADHQLHLERKRIAMVVTVRFPTHFRTLANSQAR
jgi:hypothetical protein